MGGINEVDVTIPVPWMVLGVRGVRGPTHDGMTGPCGLVARTGGFAERTIVGFHEGNFGSLLEQQRLDDSEGT